jgi:hypothetical protein
MRTLPLSHQDLSERLGLTPREIDAFCQRWGVCELALFGSIVRDDFECTSDIDMLVSFAKPPHTLWMLMEMREELCRLCQRPIDLIVKSVVESDSNPYRRGTILESAYVIYRNG